MYIPQTEAEQSQMLADCGFASWEALYQAIPAPARIPGIPGLPPAMTEPELLDYFTRLSEKNRNAKACFMGAGAYDHTVPAAVGALAGQSAFVTAYTPYQPEISQGTLTAIFEYQTLLTRLTGLDVSNAGMYDGATAACEAMHVAVGQTRRSKIAVTAGTHPQILETLQTYARFAGTEVTVLPLDEETGATPVAALEKDIAALFVQSPNFFGVLENLPAHADSIHQAGGLAVAVCDPLSLALLQTPGEAGFDIAVGDCQPMGLRLSFGGPYAGYLCARESLVRRMPGRIAGETVDRNGQRCYVLTLQTREQHIRREKAASNICSNQALCCLTATIWLALMGPEGLKEAATQSARKAAYLRSLLANKGLKPKFSGRFFREFTVCGQIEGGVYLPERDCTLIAVTEKRTKAEVEAFAEGVLA